MQDEFHLNTIWQELVVSVTIGAAALFALVGGFVSDYFGRKPAIFVSSFLFALGAIVLAAATNRGMLFVGRFIVGAGIGCCTLASMFSIYLFSSAIGIASMCSPMYIAEATPPNLRGFMVTMYNLFITAGQFVASVIDGGFSYMKEGGWRYF